MTATLQQRSGASAWNQFCEWVTSTNNRLYVGWFGVLMIPMPAGRHHLLHRCLHRRSPRWTSTASASPLPAP